MKNFIPKHKFFRLTNHPTKVFLFKRGRTIGRSYFIGETGVFKEGSLWEFEYVISKENLKPISKNEALELLPQLEAFL